MFFFSCLFVLCGGRNPTKNGVGICKKKLVVRENKMKKSNMRGVIYQQRMLDEEIKSGMRGKHLSR